MCELNWSDLPVAVSATALASQLASESGRRIGEGELVLADVRWSLNGGAQRHDYEKGHVPGAIFVDLDSDLTGDGAPEAGRHPFPTDDEFGETLSRLGISFADTVIAYGHKDPASAARFVLMLRLSGVNAAILDGGLEAWVCAGGTLEEGVCEREETVFGSQPFVRLVDIDEVAHAIPTRGAILMDARGAERFEGREEPVDPRPGHIPGARNLPYMQVLHDDGTFRSAREIRELYAQRGVTHSRITFHYCGSGVSAAVNMLAMDLAGFEHAYLYPGSYSQWSRDNARQVETGPSISMQ